MQDVVCFGGQRPLYSHTTTYVIINIKHYKITNQYVIINIKHYNITIINITLFFSAGHFGTSTMSFFRFLRWLMFLNLFLAVFMISIVLLPFLLLEPIRHGTFASSVNTCSSPFHYQAVYYSVSYTHYVQTTVEKATASQKMIDILQGTVCNLRVIYLS